MTRQDIINAISNCNYSYIGIRHLAEDESYSIGDYCRNSYGWEFIGTPVLIAGNRATCGNDEGELIITDAVVIATLDNMALAA